MYSRYEASSCGQLRSNNYKNSGKSKILKPALSKDGYYQTMLQDDNGKYHSRKVHWFVCMAFFGERHVGFQVNHKDGNKINNTIENLEYCTIKDNIKHAYEMGLITPKVGSLNGNSKLSEQDVFEIRKYVAQCPIRYYGRKKLAVKYGVSECTIKEIVTRRKNKFYNV